MAVFDIEQQRIFVRLVYDGPASAGKTTNLRQLCSLFSTSRRTELITPAESEGRTLYFDWVQIAAGLACGFPLVCQVIAVPGQIALELRRAHLLSRADVVVFVCDSSRRQRSRLARSFATLKKELDRRASPVPLIVQANKQDKADAMQPSVVLEQLGVPPDTVAHEARALEGVGVLETFVAAVRAISNQLQQRAGSDLLDVFPAETAAEVLRELEDEPVAGDLEALEIAEDEPQERPRRVTIPFEPEERASIGPAVATPPMPSPDVPTGFIWPSTGRDVVRRLEHQAPILRDDLVARQGTSDGSGKSDTIVYQCGDLCLKTSLRRRFVDAEAGRSALLRAARAKTQLGELCSPQTVLVLQPSEDQGHWLWTVAPWLSTLRARMNGAEEHGDVEELAGALVAFARAAGDAMVLAARQGVLLDLHPSNYAEHGGKLVYIDDDIGAGKTNPALGHAILRRVDEYEGFPFATSAYLDALESEIVRRLTQDDVARLDLRAGFEDAMVRTEAALAARARIARALDGLRAA